VLSEELFIVLILCPRCLLDMDGLDIDSPSEALVGVSTGVPESVTDIHKELGSEKGVEGKEEV
jgi:hypothetical protein